MVVGNINLQETRGDTTDEKIEDSIWLDEIQKIKDENKPKKETSDES